MKITKINIPINLIENGLKPIEMQRMGQIVLLTGKNGSGKTRLLNQIMETIENKPSIFDIELAESEIKKLTTKKNDLIIKKNKLKEQLKSQSQITLNSSNSDAPLSRLNQEIKQNKTDLKTIERDLYKAKNVLGWNYIETNYLAKNYKIIPFIPKSLDLVDSSELSKNLMRTKAKDIDSVGINFLAEGTFARIQAIQEKYFIVSHQDATFPAQVISAAKKDYNNLCELIKIFLNTDLGRNQNGDPLIFNLPLGRSKLSDGQKVLIQLCLAIHCQNKSLDELILFLDEPENHLHPSVIIETIEKIISLIPNGQIWIATHSIPLLASLNSNNIWYVEEGKVSYAGTIPEKVLSSLIGDVNQISKLQDFISLPGIYALNNYAFECLLQPAVKNTTNNDPQSMQIKEEIKHHLADNNKIRVVDYGAGKGRILSNIIENNREQITTFIKWFDYNAFDKYETDKEECLSVIGSIYPDFKKRYFNDFNTLFTINDRESFDVVVMCNVFHEIDPNEWLDLFSKGGKIPSLLAENGILLIIEDQEIPIGEKAFQKGFIVLDTPELKSLFKINQHDVDFDFTDAYNNGRLKAHRIKKEYLMRITSESRIECLKILNKKAISNIKEIRLKDPNYKNGRKHGFWIQQLANTILCLNELTNDNI